MRKQDYTFPKWSTRQAVILWNLVFDFVFSKNTKTSPSEEWGACGIVFNSGQNKTTVQSSGLGNFGESLSTPLVPIYGLSDKLLFIEYVGAMPPM